MWRMVGLGWRRDVGEGQAMRVWLEDLWHGLTYRSGFEKNRRSRWAYALRSARCSAGVHWPISNQLEHGGSWGPPEPCWGCEFCGHERLPYRAWFWTPRPRWFWRLVGRGSA